MNSQKQQRPNKGALVPGEGYSLLSRKCPLKLTTVGGLSYLADVSKQDGSILQKYTNVYNPHPPLVTRRSFYAVGQSCVINLNPTQSQSAPYPRALNLVTLLAPGSDPLKGEGTYHIRLGCSYQAVGRGVPVPKGERNAV